MKARVVMDVEGRHVDDTLVGADADEIVAHAKARVAKELGWKGLFINALSPIAFAQKAVELYNRANNTHYAPPQTAAEFLKLGQELGYVTILADD